MALIALVGASEMLPDGGLRALVAIAGETLIERQAARLADVGVTHIAVAVGAVPADLLATCDRIRRRGMKVTPVREASDLMALVEGDDRIILVADGLRAGSAHYAAIAKPGSPAILVTADTLLTQGSNASTRPGAGAGLPVFRTRWCAIWPTCPANGT